MQLGDWQAAQPILARMLAQDSAHPRALQLSKLAKAAASSLPHQGDTPHECCIASAGLRGMSLGESMLNVCLCDTGSRADRLFLRRECA